MKTTMKNMTTPLTRVLAFITIALASLLGLLAGCSTSESPGAAAAPDQFPTGASPATPPTSVAAIGSATIMVAADASLTLNGRKVKVQELAEKLSGMKVAADAEIRVDSHPEAPFNAVVAVMRELREKGFTRTLLNVQKKTDVAAPKK